MGKRRLCPENRWLVPYKLTRISKKGDPLRCTRIPNLEYCRRLIIARVLLRWRLFLDQSGIKTPQDVEKRLKTYTANRIKEKYARGRMKRDRLSRLKLKPVNPSNSLRAHILPDNDEGMDLLTKHIQKCWNSEIFREIESASITARYSQSLEKQMPDTNEGCLTQISRTMFKHDRISLHKQLSFCLNSYSNRVSSSWVMWNAAVMICASKYKDDPTRMVQMARDFQREILPSYPLRLAVEVSTWLFQKDRVEEALKLMSDAFEKTKMNIYKKPIYRDSPRKIQFDVIQKVFAGINLYGIWKNPDSINVRGTVFSAGNAAAQALSNFQEALDLAETTNCDISFFLMPFVETLMHVKTEFDGLKLFQNVLRQRPNNFVIEEMYYKFLVENFLFYHEEIEQYSKRQAIYTPQEPENQSQNIEDLRAWKQRKLKNAKRNFYKV